MDLQDGAPSAVERRPSIELALASKLAVLLQREVSRLTAPIFGRPISVAP